MPDLIVTDATCTVIQPSGRFCDGDALPEAPFNVCLWHAAELLRYINGVLPEDAATLVAAQEVDDIERTPAAVEVRLTADAVREHAELGENRLVVYYLRIGDLIKVGYTKQLHRRLQCYPPTTVLLAYEPGGRTLERQRLAQFAPTLAYPKEWFRPSAALIDHINSLRDTPLTAAQLAA